MKSIGVTVFVPFSMANRISLNIEQLGWLNAGLYGLGRLLDLASAGRCRLYKYHFVAQAIGSASLCQGRGKKIEVRLCRHRHELPPAYPRPGDVLGQRYAQGAQSLAAFSGGELVGFLWLLSGSYQEDEVRARYRLACTRSCWDFDVWVRPEDRLGFTFPRLWDEANSLLRTRAVRWSCSRISAFNFGSLSAHSRIGTVRLGTAIFLRCGGWQWMFATQAPFFHLSLHPASFPQFWFDTSGLAHFPPLEPTCNTLKK